MGDINFYLKKPEESTGNSLIYLQFKYPPNNKLVFTFGQRVDPSDWNKKKQRVKSNKATTEDGQHLINDLLDELEKVCKNAYNGLLKSGIPSTDAIKARLREFMLQNMNEEDKPVKATFYDLVDEFCNGQIKFRGKNMKPGTLRKYRVLRNHLLEFSKTKRYNVTFENINRDFYNKYISFLEIGSPKKITPQKPNSVGKDIRMIKAIMNEAVDQELTENRYFQSKKFATPHEDTDAVYLTDREIMKLYKMNLKNNPRLEKVRDLFVFGCYVGLRFSDFTDIKPENIVKDEEGEYFIRIITKKTNEPVIIPCNPIILELFKKYELNPNKLPPSISNEKFNVYVKEVCKEAGFTEKGRLMTEPDLELWECVSSHTARRSFATNLYLEGFPIFEIMKITGHRSQASFLGYIKVSKLDAAKNLSKHIKKKWDAKFLRVA